MSFFRKILKSVLMIITIVCMVFVMCNCEKKPELSNNSEEIMLSTDSSVQKSNQEDEKDVLKEVTDSNEITISNDGTDTTEISSIAETTVETTKNIDYQKDFVIDFEVKKVNAVRFVYMKQTTEVVNVLETTQEIKRFLKCLESDAWSQVKDGENWPKYSPSLPNEYGIIIEGTKNELAIIHLYTENVEKKGAVSLAVYEEMILKPKEYAPYLDNLEGFNRYWLEKDVHSDLYQMCS